MSEKICMNCMRHKEADTPVCPFCGFDERSYEAPPMALLPGSRLANGKYLVGRTLGQGGFGVTYLALDQFLELRVAIKEYLPRNMAYRSGESTALHWHSTVTDKQSGRESFIKEAKKMARMDDIPGVVRVKEVFYENDTAYIVMDYVEGETLLQYLKRTGPLSAKACLNLLRPVMQALSEAHSQGMIHRDVSPDNIMLDRRNRIWLLDLGAAKELDMMKPGQGSNSTTMVVKPGFSPLEQYASGGNIGPWTDVYAMCATIFYCMSGSLLPLAPDRVMNPLLELPDTIPSDLADVLVKGLAPLPENRIQSITDLWSGLAKAAGIPDTLLDNPGEEEKPEESEDWKKPEEPESWKKPEEPEEWSRPEDGETHQQWQPAPPQTPQQWQPSQQEWQTPQQQWQPPLTPQPSQQEWQTPQQQWQPSQPSQTSQQQWQPPQGKKKKRTIGLLVAVLSGIILLIVAVIIGVNSADTSSSNSSKDKEETRASEKKADNSENQDTDETEETEEPAKIAASGKCGTNASWTLDENGLLTISGTGAMKNYLFTTEDGSDSVTTDTPWWDYRDQILEVKIESGITSIGDLAFCYCEKLSGITIPDGVTRIGEFAFAVCDKLDNVVIPGSVKSIGEAAFIRCHHLSSIEIPSGVTDIESDTFWGCRNLDSIVIPDSVKSIGETAFENCDNLMSVSVPADVVIADDAFPEDTDVTRRGGTGSTTAEILDSGKCGSNASWTLDGNGILTISGSGTMYNYSASFNDEDIEVDSPWWSSRRKIVEVRIESGITSIGQNAFYNCPRLSKITIPSGVTRIGSLAFALCDSLDNVVFPASVKTIETGVFLGCSGLSSFVIPDGVTSIEADTFWSCEKLSSIVIPDSVKSIGATAFEDCESLKSVSVPADVEIADDAFPEDTVITRRSGGTVSTTAEIVDSGACGENVTWTLYENGLIVFSGQGAMTDYDSYQDRPWDQYTHSISRAEVQEGITHVGANVLSLDDMTEYSLPSTVTELGEKAFFYCNNLTHITMPDTVRSMGRGVFYSCSNVKSIQLSKSLTAIPNRAFCDCESLESIEIPTGVTEIGYEAFSGCTALEEVSIPDTVVRIGSGAFDGCENLKSVRVPAGAEIADNAFPSTTTVTRR